MKTLSILKVMGIVVFMLLLFAELFDIGYCEQGNVWFDNIDNPRICHIRDENAGVTYILIAWEKKTDDNDNNEIYLRRGRLYTTGYMEWDNDSVESMGYCEPGKWDIAVDSYSTGKVYIAKIRKRDTEKDSEPNPRQLYLKYSVDSGETWSRENAIQGCVGSIEKFKMHPGNDGVIYFIYEYATALYYDEEDEDGDDIIYEDLTNVWILRVIQIVNRNRMKKSDEIILGKRSIGNEPRINVGVHPKGLDLAVSNHNDPNNLYEVYIAGFNNLTNKLELKEYYFHYEYEDKIESGGSRTIDIDSGSNIGKAKIACDGYIYVLWEVDNEDNGGLYLQCKENRENGSWWDSSLKITSMDDINSFDIVSECPERSHGGDITYAFWYRDGNLFYNNTTVWNLYRDFTYGLINNEHERPVPVYIVPNAEIETKYMKNYISMDHNDYGQCIFFRKIAGNVLPLYRKLRSGDLNRLMGGTIPGAENYLKGADLCSARDGNIYATYCITNGEGTDVLYFTWSNNGDEWEEIEDPFEEDTPIGNDSEMKNWFKDLFESNDSINSELNDQMKAKVNLENINSLLMGKSINIELDQADDLNEMDIAADEILNEKDNISIEVMKNNGSNGSNGSAIENVENMDISVDHFGKTMTQDGEADIKIHDPDHMPRNNDSGSNDSKKGKQNSKQNVKRKL